MMQVARDILPLGEFKTQASKLLRSLPERDAPLIVTQNGRPAAVVLSPEAYDRLVQQQAFLTAVHKGLLDVQAGRVIPDDALDAFLAENFEASQPDE